MRVQIGAIVPHRKKRRDESNDRRRERESDKHCCDCANADDYFRLGLHFCFLPGYGHLGIIKRHSSPGADTSIVLEGLPNFRDNSHDDKKRV